MKVIHAIASVVLLLSLTALPLRADKTLRGKLRSDASALKAKPQAPVMAFDTLASPLPGEVRLSGYDKPLNSRHESLFVTNNLKRDISSIEITIVYTDLQGRKLHQTSRRIRADIPQGETRRIQFPSWDTQNSFYYRHSRRPRTVNVTPYEVTCTVDTCVLFPPDN